MRNAFDKRETGIGPDASLLEAIEAEIQEHLEMGGQIRAMYMQAYAAAATPIVIKIGKALEREKAQCRKMGIAFADRIREVFGFSQRTANNYMLIASEIEEGSELTALPYTKVLALTALPSGEREAFAREVGAADMSKKELQAAVREKLQAEARAQQAEARAEQAEQRAQQTQKELECARAAGERQANFAETYMREYRAAIARVEELERAEPETITIREVVPPEDYDQIKAQAARMQRRAEDAEAAAEAQEAELRRARAECNRLRMAQAEAAATPSGANPYAPEAFTAACRDFFAALSGAPHMRSAFARMTTDEREACRSAARSIQQWAEGTLEAIGEDMRSVSGANILDYAVR